MIKALSWALEASLQSEIDLYSKVTDEEFEVLRLVKRERVKEVVRYANVGIFFNYRIKYISQKLRLISCQPFFH